MKPMPLFALIAACGFLAGTAAAAETPKTCGDSEYRRFDFWIGDILFRRHKN